MGKRRQEQPFMGGDLPKPPSKASTQPLVPKTEAQRQYLSSITGNTLTFGIGPAGTGKTYVSIAHAADLLKEKLIERLIVARPAVEAGESIGFLPGEFGEKFAPYFQPALDVLNKRLGAGHVEAMIRSERIVPAHIGFIRGLTFDNAMVILDEAQNTTPSQMKLFLTRIGTNSRVVVDGDLRQSDIKGPNGLEDALYKLEGMKGCGVVRFTNDDIVRSGIVRDIICRYEGTDGQRLMESMQR